MIIKNSNFVKVFTPRNVIGITIWPFIMFRNEPKLKDINHEKIHLKQQLELIIIIFYLWYLIEAIFKGYRNISFEKEAYNNEDDENYLKVRKPYAFLKYEK